MSALLERKPNDKMFLDYMHFVFKCFFFFCLFYDRLYLLSNLFEDDVFFLIQSPF